MLPGADGFEIFRRLRGMSQLPVIFLTALGETTDRIVGLELGADDYLTKPFEPRELLARIRTVLRRAKTAADTPRTRRLWRSCTLRGLDPGQNGPSADRARRACDPSERRGVPALADFSGASRRVLSRDDLLERTQGRSATAFDRSIDVQISRLRIRLRDNGRQARIIKTVRGGGYVLAADVDADGSRGTP